jgi:hypothetical protein
MRKLLTLLAPEIVLALVAGVSFWWGKQYSVPEKMFHDWHTAVRAEPLGLYLQNEDDEALECSLLPRTSTIQGHHGWWLGGPGVFYECHSAKEKRAASGVEITPACASQGEVCTRWHNATMIWQWDGEGNPAQFPTVVCDQWKVRR